MKRSLVWLVVAAAVLIGFLFYRYDSRSKLDVGPSAERVIEKARRR